MQVFKTSFGMFVNCDYQTYRKIKAIKSVINVSYLKICRWNKWVKKLEKNRVKKISIIKDGKRIGYNTYPYLEPKPCEIFYKKVKVKSNFGYNNEWFSKQIEIEKWDIIDGLVKKWSDIFYQTKPVNSENDVKELTVSVQEINDIYDKILPYYEKYCKNNNKIAKEIIFS